MHYHLFRWFPKSAFSRLMGALASRAWPGPLLRLVIGIYIRFYRIDMGNFEVPPQGFSTFNAFFTRPLKAGARPIDSDPSRLVSPVDGTVSAAGTISQGRLIQAKGMDYSLGELLAGAADPAGYEGGSYLTIYLSPRDYHRIHAPCAAQVTGFAYVPGELWTVSPSGLRSVPGLFARNERLLTVLSASWGEALLIAVGAMVVGKIRVVYEDVTSNIKHARPHAGQPARPCSLEKGGELGRFELGSTVILLFPPGMVTLNTLRPGEGLMLGQAIGTVRENHSRT
jgi:phosphatidylserine decarboxylase